MTNGERRRGARVARVWLLWLAATTAGCAVGDGLGADEGAGDVDAASDVVADAALDVSSEADATLDASTTDAAQDQASDGTGSTDADASDAPDGALLDAGADAGDADSADVGADAADADSADAGADVADEGAADAGADDAATPDGSLDAAGDGGADADAGLPPCTPATVVLDWSASPPPALVRSGTSWSIGAATASYGPPGSAGVVMLATVPGGKYAANRDDTAMLPTLDFSAYAGCAVDVSFQVWRDTDTYDGGNLQVTSSATPDASSSWALVGGYPGTMAYDRSALSTSSCAAGCPLYGQPVWGGPTSSVHQAKGDLTAFAGLSTVTLRVTFHSDYLSEYAGIYLGNMTISAH